MSLKGQRVRADDETTHLVADEVVSVDVKDAIRRNTHYLLLEELDEDLETPDDEAALRAHLERRLDTLLGHEATPLSEVDRRDITSEVIDGLLGNGPLDRLLDDPTVNEIMVNGPHHIYVERAGRIYPHDRVFVDEAHFFRVIRHMLSLVGRRAAADDPIVDARLPNGALVNVILPPLALDGPLLTIRKPMRDPFTVHDLIAFGTMSEKVAEFLEACVQGRLNVLISGGMRAGKTTLLNILGSYIPNDERVVTIEDATELQLPQHHVLRLATWPIGVSGGGAGINASELVVNALRMRPDRIVVGELRGGEAFDLLQAISTGHDGTMAAIHAASPRDALDRLEVMSMLGGVDVRRPVVREQVSSALDIVVHLARLRDGTRRIVQISQVGTVVGGSVELNDLLLFDSSSGVDEDGRFRGELRPTGVRPRFGGRLEEMGVHLPHGLFEQGSD